MARVQQKALTSDPIHATFFKGSLKLRKLAGKTLSLTQIYYLPQFLLCHLFWAAWRAELAALVWQISLKQSTAQLCQSSFCYQNTFPLSKGCSGTVRRCTCLPQLEILLGGDVICMELTLASHTINRTIKKKIVMFGKSQIIYRMLVRVLLGQLQAGL